MVRLIWLGIIGLAFLVSGCAKNISSLDRYKAQRHYEYGLAQFLLQDTKAARQEFEQAKSLNPEAAKIYQGLALVDIKQHDYKAALINLQQAIARDPGLGSAYQHMSDIYLKLAQWGNAIEYAEKALALPTYNQPQQAHYNQGVAWFSLGEYAKAEHEFTRTLELTPRWAEARLWLGKSLFAQGKPSLAIVEYRNALAQLQQNTYEQDKQLLSYLHYQLGAAYIDKGYLKQGVLEFRLSLDIYPSSEVELALQEYDTQK